MISAFTNCLKIPELRDRIIFTMGMLFIARIGANIPLPGIDPTPLQDFFTAQSESGEGSILGLYNMFTGGAFLNGAICALGIMPYISAAIIMQLMGAVVPSLARLQQEGETGRQKITQYTRYLTVGICLVQSMMLVQVLLNPTSLFTEFDPIQYGSIVVADQMWFALQSTIFLTAGVVLLMWLGEQVTSRGIGNGVSMLITIGILAELPRALGATVEYFQPAVGTGEKSPGFAGAVLLLGLLFITVAGIVAVTQATRKIPVTYAKRVVGRKMYGGQSTFLPLKVNYSGVMPVIFASAILMFFQQFLSFASQFEWLRFLRPMSGVFAYNSWSYIFIFGLMILVFSYFWVSMMFKPQQIADDLKKYGGYIPGVRPGDATAKYLDHVMTRLTLAGSIFLTVIAVFPIIMSMPAFFNIPYSVTQFFGGTGMLIIVGVTLDTLRQIETYLLQRRYDGFMKKGKIKGRSRSATAARTLDTSDLGRGSLKTLWFVLGGIFMIGVVASVARFFLG